MDLYWRDSLTCPTEEEYIEMVSNSEWAGEPWHILTLYHTSFHIKATYRPCNRVTTRSLIQTSLPLVSVSQRRADSSG